MTVIDVLWLIVGTVFTRATAGKQVDIVERTWYYIINNDIDRFCA